MMKTLLQLLGALALLAVIVPPMLYLADAMDKGAMQGWMLGGTVLWFVAAPLRHRLSQPPPS